MVLPVRGGMWRNIQKYMIYSELGGNIKENIREKIN